jgi:hypothetical protein
MSVCPGALAFVEVALIGNACPADLFRKIVALREPDAGREV